MLVALALILAALAAAFAPPAHAAPPTQRFALVIGANDGGPDRVKLRYATRDAQSFADVMTGLGGVAPTHLALLSDPGADALDLAFAALNDGLVAAQGSRRELLVYYSGHADEKGLLFGGRRLGYSDLRARVQALPADVRVTIVDACASGALIRAKGGHKAPPFLLDKASSVRGVAYLASASADEAAQESDRIQASFFSHALLTGLRGAADVSGDQVVTLNEAYQFAFRETLQRTEGTRLGAQHPSYDMQLMGSGDVVLTDLRRTTAGLALADELGGRFFVRDGQGRLVAELHKPVGQPIQLGLPAGDYQVRLDAADGARLGGRVAVAEGGLAAVDRQALAPVDTELAVARGDAPDSAQPGALARVDVREVDFGVSVVPGLATDDGEAVRHVSVNLVGRTRGVDGVEASAIGGSADGPVDGVQGAGIYAVAEGVDGVQGAGIFAWNKGPLDGVQGAGVFTYNQGTVRGVQGTSVAAVAGRVEGLQGSAVVALAGSIKGVQGTAVAAVAGQVEGVQGAAVAAVAERVKGLQATAVVSVAGQIKGVQASGLVSVAERVEGLQLGLITVAEHVDGAAIALIPWVGDGRHIVEIGSTELTPTSLGVRLGNDVVHSKLELGWDPDAEHERLAVGAGLGGHFDFPGPVDLNVDAMWHLFWTGDRDRFFRDEPQKAASLRALGEVHLGAHVALVAGPTWTAAYNEARISLPYYEVAQAKRVRGNWFEQWPGFMVGIQLF